MSNHSEEDYLDQLLYSLSDGSSAKKTVKEKPPATTQEEFERELFGDPVLQNNTAKDEEEFLREFEAELLKDEFPDVGENFDTPLFEDEEKIPEEQLPAEASLDDILAGMSEPEKVPPVDEDAEFEGELPEETPEPEQPSGQESPSEEPVSAVGEEDGLSVAMGNFDGNLAEENASGEENVDLSGMQDKDLMDMLSGDEQLMDLGEMLSDQEEGKPLEGEDSIGQFAQNQMEEQKQAISEAEEAGEDDPETIQGKKKKKKQKKAKKNPESSKEKGPSVMQKLSRLFFGAESDDIVEIPDDGSGEIMELSVENQQILKELAEAEQAEKSGKEKKPKKKKEKAKKPPKPKKEKKPKAPKPKKEKKPKPVDHTPPLPKGPVIAIVIMVISLMVLVLLGTSTLGYQSNINAAKESYEKGAYLEAYQKMQGLKVKKQDEALYNKLAALAAVSEKYQAFLIFDNYGAEDMALDSLVCAYGRYEINRPYAEEYGCMAELSAIQTKIADALEKEFSMKEEEAAELYQIKDRDEYTIRIHEKLKELE